MTRGQPALRSISKVVNSYRQRNLVERFYRKLKQFRGTATRCDNGPASFLAVVKRAATRIWIGSL
ncbi:transposase [Rhizobium sp. L1K21]|uniref:transposase n=1 Tax=Rhizobium sp. L1K21 TaxID=2954933 RepID=UPI003592FBF3